jgi:hypothetical protein
MWALQSQTVPLLEGNGVGLRSLWCRGLSFISPAATLGPSLLPFTSVFRHQPTSNT